MGLIKSLFGKRSKQNAPETKVPWVPLNEISMLDSIQAKSDERPQLIFKHSTTCGISRMVLNMFNGNYGYADEFDTYYLDLHAHRDISNGVAQKFGVIHQSPQLLVVKNGQVVYHTSHGAITDVDLNAFL